MRDKARHVALVHAGERVAAAVVGGAQTIGVERAEPRRDAVDDDESTRDAGGGGAVEQVGQCAQTDDELVHVATAARRRARSMKLKKPIDDARTE